MAVFHDDMRTVDLGDGDLEHSSTHVLIGGGDISAYRFGVRLFRNGVSEAVSGSCRGYFIRSDGQTITLTGTVSGNEAYVTLTEDCCAFNGAFSLAIKLIGGGVTCTVRLIKGMVARTLTT